MLSFFKKLFGAEPNQTDFSQLVKEGAIIVDVRTKSEYDRGHINGSINISVDKLPNNLHLLNNKDKPIITCCASGNRSTSALNFLKTKGYSKLYNGGGWQSLSKKIM